MIHEEPLSYDDMPLQDIEKLLKIKPVRKEQLPGDEQTRTLELWKEVKGFLEELREQDRMTYLIVSVYGYELLHDDSGYDRGLYHIRLYYKATASFC